MPNRISHLESLNPAAGQGKDVAPIAEHPLSYGQRALWFLHLLAPERAAYNMFLAVRVLSTPNVSALRRAFQMLLDRHPSLRTTYVTRDGKPVQQIHDKREVHFDLIDASTWSADDLDKGLIRAAHQPFDLERGPLFRVSLFVRADRQHVLLLTAHHIAVDLWSLVLLMDELRLMRPDLPDDAQSLPPLPDLRYTDYARWQAEMLAGPRGERLWDFWRDQLAGEIPLLNLPVDRPVSSAQTYRGVSRGFKLDEEMTRQINLLAKTEQASVYMILLAVFQVLLYRYSGQEDILVGSPASGRSRAEFKKIIGYFVNPLVLRANLSGNPAFKEFLRKIRHTVLAALKRQDYPFPLLVERLHSAREQGRSPLFQVMFLFQKPQGLDDPTVPMLVIGEAGARMKLMGHDVESFALIEKASQFDLELTIVDAGASLYGALHYDTDLFDDVTVARMAEHFKTLVAAGLANPEARLSELTLLTEAEENQLLSQWNDTRADYPERSFVHHLFEAQAAQAPDAIALIFQDEGITYGELNRRANRLALHLRDSGVGPEKLVGIYLKRSPGMVVGMLAVLKAGGAYLPLDPLCPKARLAFMLDETGPWLLLTESQLTGQLPECAARVFRIDAEWQTVALNNDENLGNDLAADNLAYVLYTSGSTGRPKGVMVSYRSLNNFLAATNNSFKPETAGVWLAVTNNSFDLSILELLWTITRGFKVVIHAGDETAANAQDYSLPTQIARHRVSHLQCTPSMISMLMLNPQTARALRSVPNLVLGGEALSLSLVHELIEAAPHEVRNVYGPTETTVWSATYLFRESQPTVPIGRPISNTQIYILDGHLHPLPVGVPGELRIGGDGLARGYLHHPDLTAEKFIPDRFGKAPGARLYGTGDLARYLSDGNIEFLGRIDHQVKVRGYRVEAGEIEAALAEHPAVREAVIVAHEYAPAEIRLVAYLVMSEEVTDIDLRDFLKQKLPDYMIPSVFMRLGSLPLTPNGKINRKALPPPHSLRPESRSEYVAPQTSLEQAIASIWKQVLQIENVGARDNFFDLGGHSLLVAQVQSKLRDRLNADVPVVELFKYPTICSLAERLGQGQNEQPGFLQASERARSRKQAMSRQKRVARGRSNTNE